tara:strand:+ start:397 stop:615 length:219 start_codon:yes stop_codon:yes gene_type:complete
MDNFKEFIKKEKYLLIMWDGCEKHTNTYSSLRNLSSDISIDYSTISKKLKDIDSFFIEINQCFYYIQKLLNN